MHPRAIILACLCCGLAPAISAAARADGTGSLCLARVSYHEPTVKYAVPPPSATQPYLVRVDGRAAVAASAESAVAIADLALAAKHSVSISTGGRRIASFTFRFSEFETAALCLVANDFYGSFSLIEALKWPARCRC